jgi:hypothetical protein
MLVRSGRGLCILGLISVLLVLDLMLRLMDFADWQKLVAAIFAAASNHQLIRVVFNCLARRNLLSSLLALY